jgi:uncharacterized repeat protein (TIGR03803 family)
LVQGADGNFYGTTSMGGVNSDYGTVFKITPSGTLTTLFTFTPNGPDGNIPDGMLVQGPDGNFYGTTVGGGANHNSLCTAQALDGCGTVFKITPSGALTTLYSFCPRSGCTDGFLPSEGLAQGTNGDFYGITYHGGADGYGTVFKITPGGTLTTLHSFDVTDGEYPLGGLVQGTDGIFYGTTAVGGTNTVECPSYSTCGTIFEITPGGTFTSLISFDYGDGAEPAAALLQATNGEFYGTTEGGGAYTYPDGTVFSLNVGLGQFVETLPTSGKVGATVKILGSFLTGATSVTFNGTPATFTVNSKSEITTTVPAGATTGTVQVVTPRLGTLSSNVPFTVRP